MTTKALKDVQKFIEESLGFLEISWIRIIFMALVILYIIGGIPLLTAEIVRIFHHPLIKVGIILLILYIGLKDIPLALLLALAFVLSLQMGYRYQMGAQIGASPTGLSAGAEAGVGDSKIALEAKLGNVEGMLGQKDEPQGGNYNRHSDCVQDCADGDLGRGSLDSPCKGVGVWEDSFNAQGLNCPLGFSGDKDGAPF
jgi:hypothetical protein